MTNRMSDTAYENEIAYFKKAFADAKWEIADLRAELAAVTAERDAVLFANRDNMRNWNMLKADYDQLQAALQSERSRAWLAGRKAGADCAREWAVFGVASDIDAIEPPAEFAPQSEAAEITKCSIAPVEWMNDPEVKAAIREFHKRRPSDAAPVERKIIGYAQTGFHPRAEDKDHG